MVSLGLFGQEATPYNVSQVGTIFKVVPVRGNPYFEEEFKPGELQLGGQTLQLEFRLNAVKEQVEIRDVAGNQYAMARKTDLVPVFGGRKFYLMSYFEDGALAKGYFIPLVTGKVSLYFKPKKVFNEAELPDHGYDTFEPPLFRDLSSYYIQRGTDSAEFIRLGRAPILKFLETNSTELKDYIKAQQLNMNQEAGVISLLTYYNSFP